METKSGKRIESEQDSKKQTLIVIGASILAIFAVSMAVVSFRSTVNGGVDAAQAKTGDGPPPSGARATTTGPAQMQAPGGRGGAGGGGGAQRQQQMMARMVTEVGLNDSQKAQVKAIQDAAMPQMQALRKDTSLSQDDRRKRFREMREQTNTQIRQILTPDQQAKFDKWQAERQQRRPGAQ